MVPVFQHLTENDNLPNQTIRRIIEDQEGYMWFATNNGVARYDGYSVVTQFSDSEASRIIQKSRINDLSVSTSGLIWIASDIHGLFYYDGMQMKQPDWLKSEIYLNTNVLWLDDSENELWMGTDNGIVVLNPQNQHFLAQFEDTRLNHVISIEKVDDVFFIGTREGMFAFDEKENIFKSVPELIDVQKFTIHHLEKGLDKDLWIGTDQGLYHWNKQSNQLIRIGEDIANSRILEIVVEEEYIWIATTQDGLIRYHQGNGMFEQFSYDKSNLESLADNNVISLFLDTHKNLWVGNFNAGINILHTPSLQFGLEKNLSNSIYCMQESSIVSLNSRGNDLILGTTSGLVIYGIYDQKCQNYPMLQGASIRNIVSNISIQENGQYFWLTTMEGLILFDSDKGTHELIDNEMLNSALYFVSEKTDGQLFIGSPKGLFIFDPLNKSVERVKFKSNEAMRDQFYQHQHTEDGVDYFLSDKRLSKINKNNALELIYESEYKLRSLYVDGQNVWLGTYQNGLIRILPDDSKEMFFDEHFNNGLGLSIYSIVPGTNDTLWLGSDSGLIRYEKTSGEWQIFTKSDGLQSQIFSQRAGLKLTDQRLVFAGKEGLNLFHPNRISIKANAPELVLTQMTHFNQEVVPNLAMNSGFVLEKPINQVAEIELSHRDYVVGFKWAGLNYISPEKNEYAHRLVGLEEQWNQVAAENRQISYTNLSPGDYVFQVKAKTANSEWSKSPKELKIKVYPAPWLSPWAFALYAISFILGVLWFIRYRTQAARLRAAVLEQTVADRTQEVQEQKQVVERLLDQKNALFSNITHEFKTPLTLILGPLERLLQEEVSPKESSSALLMMKRNANRLLVMVEQILKLSQSEFEQGHTRAVIRVLPITQMIFDTFITVAKQKQLSFSLEHDIDDALSVAVTSETFEIILGNLLSNAVKYTPKSGHVSLKLRQEQQQLICSVTDTGPGIEVEDHERIFERFSRLETHKTVQGTGIGLAVVKELVEMCQGHIELNSTVGTGSAFHVYLPIVLQQGDTVSLSRSVIDIAENLGQEVLSDDEVEQQELQLSRKTSVESASVYMIEDNHDMRSYIRGVMEKDFTVHEANNGQSGISGVLQEMPDIVVCDVMMPGMDGYEVARILREDTRVSHIPIVLLTALNTKESRIKGWRENIDSYMTKPFDSQELLIRLHSILAIRALLQRKNQSYFDAGKPLDMPSKDNEFIMKLKHVIEENHQSPLFQKAQFAQAMAVSERQLLRKTKALIDRNPIEMLRDYRLDRAKQYLDEGHRVSLVSDQCGFNSSSYFIQCFKQKFGTTPKKYQQSIDKEPRK
ncbi:ATP-binding protein [Marinicella sp. W31]|uniref:ATP-binding protein n=1 Tax=Marinicella sp. W31 TaxID=3023713 RepID=UPI0037581A22